METTEAVQVSGDKVQVRGPLSSNTLQRHPRADWKYRFWRSGTGSVRALKQSQDWEFGYIEVKVIVEPG